MPDDFDPSLLEVPSEETIKEHFGEPQTDNHLSWMHKMIDEGFIRLVFRNDVLFQVVDINGKLILNEKINEMKTHSINCETWINGVYFISLSNNQNNKYSTKLIIN